MRIVVGIFLILIMGACLWSIIKFQINDKNDTL